MRLRTKASIAGSALGYGVARGSAVATRAGTILGTREWTHQEAISRPFAEQPPHGALVLEYYVEEGR